MTDQTLLKQLCFILVLGQVVALKCHITRHSGSWMYKLSQVPGKNCIDYWRSNGTTLADEDGVWEHLVEKKGVDYLITNTCLPRMVYTGHCREDWFPEAKCEGMCPLNTPAPTEVYSKGHHAHPLSLSYVMVALCLGLTLFTI